MVDLFSLALSHGLMALAAWRLILREDLDADPGDPAVPARPSARAIRHQSRTDA